MKLRIGSRQALTECICEFGAGTLLLFYAASGKYLSYVAPRIRPFLFLGAAILIGFGIFRLPTIRFRQHRNHSAHCLLLIIPVLLLLLPHESTQTVAAGLTATPKIETRQSSSEKQQDTDTTLSGLDTSHKHITVSNQDFYPWMEEINEHLNKYIGYSITMTGFVLKNSVNIHAGEFVPARLAMTCCTADLTPMGLLCKYDKAASLKENAWVTVEGTLLKGTFQGSPDPQIQVSKVTSAQPVSDYIYPYQ
ncbi:MULTISPECIES: TIGR03943 family putative permease subunit [Caproicibacterium]|uniref:TIGR03943 family protein n=1 Tax=Caproicibacterium argilliputei TaxID=3030016 RepID=A0AA97DAU5_9FIRM|nr:TIGR03943 family protein [Caproicibacterium argilliputei]WOC33506.1 TIGR03943 family protein [Caproicibacterium argilliputei]